MHIEYSNRELLENVRVHDSAFDGFEYLYIKRQVKFNCTDSFDRKNFSFVFNNVIYFDVQSCYFWGEGANILWLSLVDDKSQINELLELKNDDWHGFLNEEQFFVQVEFQLNSGDTIFIICESIDIDEDEM